MSRPKTLKGRSGQAAQQTGVAVARSERPVTNLILINVNGMSESRGLDECWGGWCFVSLLNFGETAHHCLCSLASVIVKSCPLANVEPRSLACGE